MAVDAVGEMGKLDFLNLLATQLKYQDPMNPVDNSEFVAQLAQFTALETAENTKDQLEKMNATNLVGKNVYGVDGEDFEPFSGQIDSVDMSANEAQIYISGKAYNLVDIQKVYKD